MDNTKIDKTKPIKVSMDLGTEDKKIKTVKVKPAKVEAKAGAIVIPAEELKPGEYIAVETGYDLLQQLHEAVRKDVTEGLVAVSYPVKILLDNLRDELKLDCPRILTEVTTGKEKL